MTRRTLASPAHLDGIGLHTGTPVEVTIHPSDQGIAFRLGGDRVVAAPENVTDTTRCTRLGGIGTIEHLMSAFAGLEITDAEVELTSPELPGLDGSAKLFVEALTCAGLIDIGGQTVPDLYRRLFIQDDHYEIAIARGAGHWRYDFLTGDRWPGSQGFELTEIVEGYKEHVAPARTFAFVEELPMIMKYGLGKGLDKDSALILGESDYENPARFADEPARHKLLDLIGDLYLAGVPIRALNVVSAKSGHTANVKAAAMLRQAIQPTE
ncbi:MAG: UDP-3-O-acyl-N-acetylglucosamine deacetylase [Fimbriimonas sp.]|nr:UDP-3-O-acyl-N-acetylglucosamine deacetylase [Fimbriimonas sp.]